MMKRLVIAGLAAASISGIIAACGGSDGSTSNPKGNTSGSGKGSGGAGGAESTASGVNTGGLGGLGLGAGGPGAGSGGNNGSGGGAACAGVKSSAELVPLDIYIMMDTSGSMADLTAQGVSKWDAVKQALTTFFTSSQNGVGVGLQFFPLPDPAVPASCTTDTQCGLNGPCVRKTCSNATSLTPCNTNADCGGGTCIALGQCSLAPDQLCAPVGARCSGGGGTCDMLTAGFCFSTDSCQPATYATPAVNIAPLSTGANALIAAMNAKMPDGATPTSAALKGALQQAHAYAVAHPDHKVIALMATDGLPTECNPTDAATISQTAAQGLAGMPSVPTFAIGVFAPADTTAGTATLNQIAAAGGTQKAFIINSSQNVSQAFLDALNAIRGKSLSCEYLVPQPMNGQTIDYGKVNVEYTPANQTQATTIYYVKNAAGCNPTKGGWYYDVDPAAGKPTKIEMCPSTCTVLKTGGQVDISVGCQTITQPPQ